MGKTRKANSQPYPAQKSGQIEVLDIYNKLLAENPPENLPSQLEDIFRGDKFVFRMSWLTFFLRLCGLSNLSAPDSSVDTEDFCTQELTRIQSEPQLLTATLFTQKHLQGHKLFYSNCVSFWQTTIFSDRTNLLQKSSILKDIVEWARLLGDCKLRTVRTTCMDVVGLVISLSMKYYLRPASSGPAKIVRNFLFQINEIVKRRIKDVDFNIRKRACAIVLQLYQNLNLEITSSSQLSETFGYLLEDRVEENVTLGLNNLCKMYTTGRNHFLTSYADGLVEKLMSICTRQPKAGISAAQLLVAFKCNSPNIVLPIQVATSLLCELSLNGPSTILLTLSQLFYRTTFQELRDANSKHILRQVAEPRLLISLVIDCFSGVPDDSKGRQRIFQSLINFDYQLFNITDMMNLLLDQKLVNPTSKELERMTRPHIQNILLLIRAYLRLSGVNRKGDQIRHCYNQILIQHAEDILLGKIVADPNLRDKYLGLFVDVETPIRAGYHTRLNTIFGHLIGMFNNESSPQILQLIVKSIQKIQPQGLQLIFSEINIGTLDTWQLSKLSCIAPVVDITERLNLEILGQLIGRFPLQLTRVQFSLLVVLHNAHLYRLRNILQFADQNSVQNYVVFRNELISLLVSTIRRGDVDTPVKDAAYKVLCNTLTLVLHHQLSQIDVLFLNITGQLVDVIFLHLHQSVLGKDPQENFQHVFTSLSNCGAQIKDRSLLDCTLEICGHSLRFCLNPLCIRLIVVLFGSKTYQDMALNCLARLINQEVKEQNKNKFYFWRVFRQIVFKEDRPKEERQKLSQQLVSLYFSNASLAPKRARQHHINKFVLFFAETVDFLMSGGKTNLLETLGLILKRSHRRVNKQVWTKIFIMYSSRVVNNEQAVQNPICSDFQKTLRKYAGLKRDQDTQDPSETRSRPNIIELPSYRGSRVQNRASVTNSRNQTPDISLRPRKSIMKPIHCTPRIPSSGQRVSYTNRYMKPN